MHQQYPNLYCDSNKVWFNSLPFLGINLAEAIPVFKDREKVERPFICQKLNVGLGHS